MILCIDTISSAAGITLVDGKAAHGYLPLDPRKASEGIIKTIDELLSVAQLELTGLSAVFVMAGPGSFTGLRVGIAVANQFAHQLKLPIVGLRAEEWWSYRMEETDFLYLQSMNKSEVYTIGFGSSKEKFEMLTPIEDLQGNEKYLGQISEAHLEVLTKDFKEITGLLSIEETWLKLAQNTPMKANKDYALVEPFYGKKVNITKSKRKLSI